MFPEQKEVERTSASMMSGVDMTTNHDRASLLIIFISYSNGIWETWIPYIVSDCLLISEL